MNSPEISVVEDLSHTSSTKRRLSLAGGDTERVIKRRAARACQSCRTRKVRCDIFVNGERCTNCKLDDLECILLTSRRGKGDRKQREGPVMSPASTRETNGIAANSIDDDNEQSEPAAHFSVSTAASTDEVPVCLTFEDEDSRDASESRVERDDRFEALELQPAPHFHQYRSQSSFQIDACGPVNNGRLQQSMSATSVPASASTGGFAADSSVELQVAPFVKPLPADMDLEDVRFLAQKGAFTIPEPELRAKILRSYVLSVHTFLPILDLGDFVRAVLHERSGGQVSLLLLQAVMFAGLSSLKLDVINKLGYETLKQARRAFFAKVRLLHDFDTEPDNTAILQSLLLMSLWYEKWNDRKHTWYWTGQALSLAQSMGFHREMSAPNLPPKAKRLRRRIWWSLYIRDRLIALGTRRPMRIKDDEFDLPMLTIQDFDDAPSDGNISLSLGGSPLRQDATKSRCLAVMCIEISKLCICIGHVLSSQYTTLGEQTPLNSTLMVIPRPPHDRAKALTKCDEELQEWHHNLDPRVRKVASDSAKGVATDEEGIPWSILYMVYLTSISLLHRPEVLLPNPGCLESTQAQRYSRERVKEAARKLTKILHTMLRRDQVRFLPTSGIPAALSAALGHMLEIKSNDEDIRDASIFRFYQTMQVLQRLREIYNSADSAVSFLASAVRKAGVSVPIQFAAQATPGFMIAGTKKASPRSEGLSRANVSNEMALAQAPRPTDLNVQMRPSQTSGYTESFNGSRNLPSDPQQRYSLLNQHPESFHGGMVSPRNSNLARLPAPDSVSGMSAEQVGPLGLSCGPAGERGNSGIDSELQREIDEVALPDPLSYWVVNEDYYTMSTDFDHVLGEEPISLSYDFCSDAFGLLDSLGRDADDMDTLAVNISRV